MRVCHGEFHVASGRYITLYTYWQSLRVANVQEAVRTTKLCSREALRRGWDSHIPHPKLRWRVLLDPGRTILSEETGISVLRGAQQRV